MNPICPICEKESVMVMGDVIYPRRPDLYSKKFFQCPDHKDLYVGTHAKTGLPLGVLADAEHRLLKMKCHSVFDPRWLSAGSDRARRMERVKCYSRLASSMNITIDQAHFGMFSKEQCKQAYKIICNWD